MKKALAYGLAFCILLSVIIPLGIVARAEDATQPKTLFEEKFENITLANSIYSEDGNYNTNNDVGGYNGWSDGTAHKNPVKPYDSNRAVNIAKIVKDGTNKAASFTYTVAGSTESSCNYLQYYVKKETAALASTGKVIFKMSAKPTEQAGMLCVNLNGASAQAEPYISFYYDKKRIIGGIVHTNNDSIADMKAGVWADYEIHIDFNSETANLYVNGHEIANTKTSLPEELTQISQVAIGLHRTQGAWAAGHGWLVDNLEVIAIPNSEVMIFSTEEALTNKAKLKFSNAPVSLTAENIKLKAESGWIKPTKIEAVTGENGAYFVTFSKNLTPQTAYSVILTGITDVYGGTIANKEITYTTPKTGNVYYVSPTGNDKNAGTKDAPWKTAYYAAQSLTAGDTAIFEDGIYKETKYTIVKNSGAEGKPITFKAQNKGKAIIFYPEACRKGQKFRIENKSYINVRDLYFTQESTAVDLGLTTDIFINVVNSSYSELTGNKIQKAYEEGIKSYCSNYITAANNEIYDMGHEGIDFFAVINPEICGNKVINFGRDAFMIKGNSANCKVYNNYAHNNNVITDGRAFDIGGASDGTSPICTKENIGFENHNSIFYNNVVYSIDIDGTPSIGAGFGFLGAENCHLYNNTIVGTEFGIRFQVPTDSEWQWFPNTVNPVIKNNIIADVTYAYSDNSGTVKPNPVNVVRDYNLFYNCGFDNEYFASDEPHSLVLSENEELFVAYGYDWRIKPDSKAVARGTAIPASYPGFIGYAEADRTTQKGSYYCDFPYDANRVINVDIDLIDFCGNERQAWDIGAHSAAKNPEEAYIAANITTAKAYDTLVLGKENDGKATVSLKMANGTTEDLTVAYTLNPEKAGLYTAEGTVDGFSTKIPVEVMVCEKEENSDYDTYLGARVILDDGTWVDTSKTGVQFYDVALSNALIHYKVNVGEFYEKFTCEMDYPEGTISGNQGSAAEGNYYLALLSQYINNESVQIVKESENSVLKIGPEAVNYGVKVKFNNKSNAKTQKISLKFKLDNIKEFFEEVNTIPYHIGIKGENGAMLSELYFRFYYNENGFVKLTVGPHSAAGTTPEREIELKNKDNASFVGFDKGIGKTDWINVSVIENADQTYNVYINDKLLISAHNIQTDATGNVKSALPVSSVDFRRRTQTTESESLKNDPELCVYVDDVSLYEYSKISEDVKLSPDVAVALNSEQTTAPVYLKMTDGSLKEFFAEFKAVDTSKSGVIPTVGTIDGINIPLDLSIKACNYAVDGIRIKENDSISAQIRKLSDKQNITALFAAYNADNVMQACDVVSLADLKAAEINNIPAKLSLSADFEKNGGYIAVYIWDYSKVQPIDLVNKF